MPVSLPVTKSLTLFNPRVSKQVCGKSSLSLIRVLKLFNTFFNIGQIHHAINVRSRVKRPLCCCVITKATSSDHQKSVRLRFNNYGSGAIWLTQPHDRRVFSSRQRVKCPKTDHYHIGSIYNSIRLCFCYAVFQIGKIRFLWRTQIGAWTSPKVTKLSFFLRPAEG